VTNIPANVMEIIPHERPAVHVIDNMTYFRMSAVGYCIKQLVLARLGYDRIPSPPHLAMAAKEGHLHEAAAVEQMTEDGWFFSGRQSTLTVQRPLFTVIGHPDGIAVTPESFQVGSIGPEATVLVEMKALSNGQFERFTSGMWENFPHYADQLSMMMEATKLPAIYRLKNRNTGAVRWFDIPEPPSKVPEILAKLTQVEILARKERIPDCAYGQGSFECTACPYRYACHARGEMPSAPVELASELGPMELADLQNSLAALRRGKALEAEAKELIEPARAQLEALLHRAGTSRLSFDGVRWSLVKGRKYYPVDRIRAVLEPSVLQLIERESPPYMKVEDRGK